MFPILHRSIITKLAFVCVLIFIFVGGIVLTNFFSFNEVKQLLVTIIERDVAKIINNAQLGRELSQVFADTNLLVSTFIDQPEYLKTERSRLLDILQRNISPSVTGDTENLRQTLQEFTLNLETLLNHCALLNETSQNIDILRNKLATGLVRLDDKLAETMIAVMMEGSQDKIFAVEQLGTMLSGYRDTHSQVTILLAQVKQKHLRQNNNDEGHENEQQILELLKELHANLMAVTRAGQNFTELGEQLLDIVNTYQESVVVFHQHMNEFQTQVTHVKTIEGQLIEEMGKLDTQIVQATNGIRKEAMSAIQGSQNLMAYLSGMIIFLLLGIGYYAFRLVHPIKKLAQTADQLAEGNINCALPAITSHDEIGTLSRAFHKLMLYIQEMASAATEISRGNLSQKLTLRSEQDVLGHAFRDMSAYLHEMATAAESIAAGDLRQNIQARTEHDILGNAFQQMKFLHQSISDIMSGAVQLRSASEGLNQISAQMVSAAEQTSQQTHIVSSNSQQISKNVNAIAVSTEEFSANIREISKNTTDVAQVAGSAVEIAASANTIIAELETRSEEIGEIIKIITAITQQTNLLALNATIEAARAGDAGKGFAVVANEIKELSRETAISAEDIIHKLEAIQTGSKGAREAIDKVSTTIMRISDLSESIASGTEEQSVTTDEIVHRITETAGGSQEIAQVIIEVAAMAQNTSKGAAKVQVAARELDTLADQLQQLVGRFQI